jgi:hypothetical protein
MWPIVRATPDARPGQPQTKKRKCGIHPAHQSLFTRGIVLEVGSGTGQHALQFARTMPNPIWQPSERDPDCLKSILAWLAVEEFPNVRPPVHLECLRFALGDRFCCGARVHQSDPHRTVVGNGGPLLWRQIIVERQRPPVSLRTLPEAGPAHLAQQQEL